MFENDGDHSRDGGHDIEMNDIRSPLDLQEEEPEWPQMGVHNREQLRHHEMKNIL